MDRIRVLDLSGRVFLWPPEPIANSTQNPWPPQPPIFPRKIWRLSLLRLGPPCTPSVFFFAFEWETLIQSSKQTIGSR
jgi:hypothetical protein